MLANGYVLNADGREYTVLQLLGRGANSAAYLAECRQDGLTYKCILKQLAPVDGDSEKCRERFVNSAKLQNRIRQLAVLNNQTPPLSHIFEANGMTFADVSCYNGTTLDRIYRLDRLTLPQYMEICRAIAKTAGYYHKSGFLCLDIKPENIFILQNAPDDTVTQLVEFIDFDGLCEINKITESTVIYYTREWSAPEQTNPFAIGRITEATDIYAIGEIVFYLIFGRHSVDSEHRGFSQYPFEKCRSEYRKFTERPEIQSLLTRLFRNTIRSSAVNRFKSADEIAALLDRIVTELNRKDFVIPNLPAVSPNFTGREKELTEIAEGLKSNRVLFVTGVGGIGKSTVVRNFILRSKLQYDTAVYLEFEGDIVRTFTDDFQLEISTVSRQDGEGTDEYFSRKLSAFKRICGGKRVLFVIDNYSGPITREISRIINCGYDTVIVTRSKPPKNSFASMEIGAISDSAELFKLITLNLERQLSEKERNCFCEIIGLVQGHTLVLELIARQIAAGQLDIQRALKLIRAHGFSHFSDEKVGNFKDSAETYDTLSEIISALFDAGSMSAQELTTLKVLSLLEVRGLERSLLKEIVGLDDSEIICKLSEEGWIYADGRVRVHPVIAETVRNWSWHDSVSDVCVMEMHRKIIDIYVGMSDDGQIFRVLKEAENYRKLHPRHITAAMYYDMLGTYYDVILDGNYSPQNDDEAKILQNLVNAMNLAIENAERSYDKRKEKYLVKYYLSAASVLMRSYREYYGVAKALLYKARENIKRNNLQSTENGCYYFMAAAWYFTLVNPDLGRMQSCVRKASEIAHKVFSTDLEIIDIIYIPTANCYFYHDKLSLAAETIEAAIVLCEKYPEILPYIDKRAHLLNCLLDIYMELQNLEKCREIAAEIDRINESYVGQGIHRSVSPEIRKAIM